MAERSARGGWQRSQATSQPTVPGRRAASQVTTLLHVCPAGTPPSCPFLRCCLARSCCLRRVDRAERAGGRHAALVGRLPAAARGVIYGRVRVVVGGGVHSPAIDRSRPRQRAVTVTSGGNPAGRSLHPLRGTTTTARCRTPSREFVERCCHAQYHQFWREKRKRKEKLVRCGAGTASTQYGSCSHDST
jgi:hypothetical protein